MLISPTESTKTAVPWLGVCTLVSLVLAVGLAVALAHIHWRARGLQGPGAEVVSPTPASGPHDAVALRPLPADTADRQQVLAQMTRAMEAAGAEIASFSVVEPTEAAGADGTPSLLAWQGRVVLRGSYAATKLALIEVGARHRSVTWTNLQWRRVDEQLGSNVLELQADFAWLRLPTARGVPP